LKLECNDYFFENKEGKKKRFRSGLLKASSCLHFSPLKVTSLAIMKFEPTYPWGERKELTTKPTLFQMF
jgi:hypothetical protein